jgi:hypothetical protein
MLAADRVAGRYYGKAEELLANIGGLFETIGDWLAGAAVGIQVEPAGLQRSGSRVLGFRGGSDLFRGGWTVRASAAVERDDTTI